MRFTWDHTERKSTATAEAPDYGRQSPTVGRRACPTTRGADWYQCYVGVGGRTRTRERPRYREILLRLI
ncbi:hypothetical protein J6590_037478 [Homalodisca vitripennis]|nr:hypothetical protein J6590_037478 [Homalodisca vitripennis]